MVASVEGEKMKKNGEKIWKRRNHCLIFAPAFEREHEGKRLNEGTEKKFEKKA